MTSRRLPAAPEGGGPRRAAAGVVVAGGSLAAAKTVQALRERGYEGPITLVSDESVLPYDRPPLSKEFLAGKVSEDDVRLLDGSWYAANEVDVVLAEAATGVDLTARELHLGATRVAYDDLVIATGARARLLPAALRLPGVHVLRSISHAVELRRELPSARHAVVVGGGFIGFEVASTLRELGLAVTLVEAAPAPLSRSLDPTTARAVVDHAVTTGGIDVRCGTALAALRPGPAGRVAAAVLSDGSELPADIVVVGIGAVPNVEWLAASGLPISAAGVTCDATGRAAPGVWAVGDVSAWEVPGTGRVERHEHWTAANDQARIVAQNIVESGERTPTAPAYVWSDQFGLRISIIGTPATHDEVRFLSHEIEDLAALHARDGRLVGACIVGQPRLMAQCRSWIAQRLPVDEVPLWGRAGADLITSRSPS